MDLETVIQSEVYHKEKNKYHILMHICGTKKNDMDELICKADIENREQTYGYQVWKEGEMDWENGTDIYITMYKIDNWQEPTTQNRELTQCSVAT